jgi:hypothetical protein
VTVLDVSVTWAGPPPRLSGGGTETRTRVLGGHRDASAATMVARARGAAGLGGLVGVTAGAAASLAGGSGIALCR